MNERCLIKKYGIDLNPSFVCQRGPIGPPGPSGEIMAYGGMYNNIDETINIGAGGIERITFNEAMPLHNTAVSSNTIIIEESGVYEINWKLSGVSTIDFSLSGAIRNNGVNIDSTVTVRELPLDIEFMMSGSVIVNLAASDVIDMILSSATESTVILANGTNATLSVKRLGPIQ